VRGTEELAPPAGSQPLLRWFQGPLSVPYRPGTPTYNLQAKIRRRACIRTLPRVIWLRTLPPCRDGLWHCHMPHGSAPRLLARKGSGAATCRTALDPVSLLGRAPVLSRVARLRTPPPCSVGLQCCHVPHGFGPRLPAREGSSAATCHMTSDLTTLLGRAPILPRVTRLRTPPPYSGGLQCCHVPHGSRPCLPVRGALTLSRVPRPKEGRGP
jgi:hypothetical protein